MNTGLNQLKFGVNIREGLRVYSPIFTFFRPCFRLDKELQNEHWFAFFGPYSMAR